MRLKNLIALAFAIGMSSAAYSQVVVNEFCASNDTLEIAGHTCDWVEVCNIGSDAVNLKGYAISDNPKKPQKYVINEDVTIYPGCTKLILCNGLGVGVNAGFKLSADGTENVVWTDPEGHEIDNIEVPKLPRDYSYGRISDGSADWAVFDVATPGESNSHQKPLCPMPIISQKAGFYKGSVQVSIECPMVGAEIFYTTNGAAPSAANLRYTGPIQVSANTVVRAVARCTGYKKSKVATATYFINSRNINIPVVSLSTDSKNFYDNKEGIYVAGTNGIKGNCQDQPKNWNQPWERPVHVEYFDAQKNLVVSQDCGVRITGSCSRGNDMKSLRLIARKEYGDNRFRYRFFDKKPITEFKQLVLRNGGNDFGGTMLRDALITGLAGESLDVDIQEYQPVAVFLNGEYLGLHNLREKVCTHYVEENYGADADNVDLLENDASIIDGSDAEYKALCQYARTHDLSVQSNYDHVASQMDINNFIDYWCAQIYIDNEDWPNNNIKYYKVRGANSKWRWILFGTEFSCGVYGGRNDVNSIHHDIDPNTGRLGSSQWGGELMRNLLANEGFRDQFIQRMAYTIDHTFRYERVHKYLDSLRAGVDNEWYTHGQRWFRWWHEHDAWRNSCNDLDNWFRSRAGYIRDHVRKYFGLGASFDVEVSSDLADARFSVNGSQATANINGKYYSGANLVLSASLPDGHEVDYWEILGKSGKPMELFAYGSLWKYYDQGNKPAWNWMNPDFADASWHQGLSPLGYPADKKPGTTISYGGNSSSKYPTAYFRKTVSIDMEPDQILSASITLKVDDGCVVYVNGKEQGRVQMPSGNIDYNTWSSTYYADVDDLPDNIIGIDPKVLVKGLNVIAVEVHQTSGSSSDLWMEARMDLGVVSQGDDSDKIYSGSVSLSIASDTKIRLVTKKSEPMDCADRSSSVVNSVVINEVSVRNAGNLSDETNHYPSWIEFCNKSNTLVDLAGLFVMDDNTEFQIPCGHPELTMMAPNSRAVFFLDGRPELGPQHLGITLNPDSENRIYLGEKVNGVANYVDWLEVPSIKKGYSYGRKVDGDREFVVFQKTTPFESNGNGIQQPVIPIFTPVDDIEVDDIARELQVSVYPNPTRDYVYIAADSDAPLGYELYSLSGQLLLKGQGSKVDMQGLPESVYLLKISIGGVVKSVRLIKY